MPDPASVTPLAARKAGVVRGSNASVVSRVHPVSSAAISQPIPPMWVNGKTSADTSSARDVQALGHGQGRGHHRQVSVGRTLGVGRGARGVEEPADRGVGGAGRVGPPAGRTAGRHRAGRGRPPAPTGPSRSAAISRAMASKSKPR